MRSSRRFAVLLVFLFGSSVAIPAGAEAADPHRGRLGAGLAAIAEGQAPGRSIVTRVHDAAQEIAVSVELADEPGNAIRARLRNAGLDLRGSWRRTIEGYVLPAHLERLSAVPGVRAVRAIRIPIPDAYVGQAPGIHGALPWHGAQYTGKGVKVGILDGSFDGLVARLGTELPSTVQVRCFAQIGIATQNPTDCVEAGEAHGTAVAESVIDMAPNASLYISNASSPADQIATIQWMTSNGVRIVNYSQAPRDLLHGMGDGTSPYYNSDYALVDSAVNGGALFVASAGNFAETSWSGPLTEDLDLDFVQFAPFDINNGVMLAPGESITVALRWPNASADYELLLFRGDSIVEWSHDVQASTGDPLELLSFTSEGGGSYDLAIYHASGPDAVQLKLVMHASGDAILEHFNRAGSFASPVDSRNAGMVAVGAVDFRTPTVIEPYSSQGPTLDGRIKPDLVAVDCVDTSVMAGFCGTSQAAPFVSGAAALLLEADTTLTPVTLATMLKQRAVPTGTPVPNNVFGHGLLSLGPLPIPVPVAASFLSPPATGTAGGLLLGQPTVGVVDAGSRVTGTGAGATMSVTLSLAGNPTNATLACEGGNTRIAAAGIAAFAGCAVDLPGSGYTLRADVAGLTAATSAPFSVAATGSPPPVSMTLAATSVAIGTSVAGVVAVASPPITNSPVVIEWSSDARQWNTAAELVVGTIGTAPFTLPAPTNRWLRARFVTGAANTEVSSSTFVRVNASAVLRSSIPTGRTINRTTKITLTETIRPIGTGVAAGKARFDLFLKVGTAWVRKRTLYANAAASSGKAVLVTTLPTYGSWWIRSRAEATATNGASAWTAGFKYLVR